MRVLVFGANGQLGRDLLRVFEQEGEVLGVDLPECDVAREEHVRAAIAEFRPALVINAAAFTNVEAAEDAEADAFRVNETGAGVVAATAGSMGIPVVYYSTDYVFGGTKTSPYEPDDPISPIGVYARSKARGEEATRRATHAHFIVRTAWLFGPGGNNFVEKMLALAASRPALKVVRDEIGSPTHTLDLARATKALAATTHYGTYHAVNEGWCSRFEFAQAIFDLTGTVVDVTPCASADFPTKAERPLYSVLSNQKLQAATGLTMPHWRDALREYLERRNVAV
jgi:dTDP-4-dehydrorhamnose reductase